MIDPASIPEQFRRAAGRPKTLLNKLEIAQLEAQNAAQSAIGAAKAAETGSGRAGDPVARKSAPSGETVAKSPGKRRGQMNRTEARFAAILEAKRLAGAIQSWHYEGITLRWGTLDSIRYTPDFLVFDGLSADGRIRLIEVKGGWMPKDTAQKFKAARNQWPQFTFELWRRKKGDWTQLY